MPMTTFPSGPFVLFDDSLSAPDRARSLLLHDLDETIVCRDRGSVAAALARIESAAAAGRWVGVAADYELGYWLEPRSLGAPYPEGRPLLTAQVFRRGETLDGTKLARLFDSHLATLDDKERICGVADLRPQTDEAAYLDAIHAILAYIAAGDCYQVNFTFPLHFRHYGDPLALYARLRAAQPVPHGAYLQLGDRSVLSLSPELFVERRGERLTARPMKGTAPRGADPASDQALKADLASSEKNRAENLMIVDLIRNDLGRLASIGGVRVERLFNVEAYRTLWQMTSTISADTPSRSLAEIFQALFPCGSVTGAPKVRAMQIVAELERAPRGLYTGALGYVAPGGDFSFNVPIRTLMLKPDGSGSMGIGSGIVADSDPQGELAECRLKANFVTSLAADFSLIETLLMVPSADDAYPLLRDHLQRLAASASYFGFKCDPNTVGAALLAHARECRLRQRARTRLLLHKDGSLEIRSTPLPGSPAAPEQRIVLAERRVDSTDIFRRHKTTVRLEFEAEMAGWQEVPEVFDALFCNERGELCEGARSNVFLAFDGVLHTPPLSAGVLDGVMRRNVLRDRSITVVERVLHPEHLRLADAIYVTNALRRLQRVEFFERDAARAPGANAALPWPVQAGPTALPRGERPYRP